MIGALKQTSTFCGGSRARGAAIAALVGAVLILAPRMATSAEPAGASALAADTTQSAHATEGEDGAPSASDLAIRKGRQLSDEKRFDEAAATLSAAHAADPGNTEVLSWLARIQAWGRRYDESIATYRQLLAISPGDARARAGYARVLSWSGRYCESAREFRRAIAQGSTDLETRVGYSRVLSWAGDLAGASQEYFRILETDSAYGDAWLGLASVARWRRAATAADEFVEKAAERGGDPDGVREERDGVRLALRPMAGLGWARDHEEQHVTDSTKFELETVGGFVYGRATIDRAVGLDARLSRTHSWEKNSAPATDTTLNYDLNGTAFRADLSFLRKYPLQIAGGISYARFESRNQRALFPLRADDDFFGYNARAWGYYGRVTPSVSVRRDFLPIKETDPSTGARTLVPGGAFDAELAATWDWNAHGSFRGAISNGLYTDDNDRSTLSSKVTYRARLARPRVTLDYGLRWSDFARASSSYFTPLNSVRHALGVSLDGYHAPPALDYGARYEFAYLRSSNFEDISTNSWSLYGDITLLDRIPIGADAHYSIDNNDYETWGLTLSAGARW